jgi:hypothetical protein
MRVSSLVVCSLWAVSTGAAPTPGFAPEEPIKRDVDAAMNGNPPVHIKGAYIRNSDLIRMGYDVADRDGLEARQEGVDYMTRLKKRDDEEREVGVDGVALRSG